MDRYRRGEIVLMKKLIVASNNEHKITEIKQILEDMDIEILSLKEMNIDIDVVEDGKTFIENARKKAIEIYEYLVHRGDKNFIVMSDDSGLMVDALNGRPGVYSARYAGEHGNSKKNNEKILKELQGVDFEHRGAKFVCAIALIDENGKITEVEGNAAGIIAEGYDGVEGFGYDPLFYVPEFKETFAEMTAEQKNSISHRGRALEKIREEILKYI